MTTFYLDYENGNDANGGTSWADAWKTITSGATAARIAPGDVVKIAKSPDPVNTGVTGTWTSVTLKQGAMPGTVAITSSTNASPIVITKAAHGLSNGMVVKIASHTVNTNANGYWVVANVTTNTFELEGSTGNGVGGTTGNFQNLTPQFVVLNSLPMLPVAACNNNQANWSVGTNVTSASWDSATDAIKVVTASSHAGAGIIAKYGLAAPVDLSGYQQLSFRYSNYTSALATAGDIKVKLYSDAACTTEVESFDIPPIASSGGGSWANFTVNKGSALSATVQGIALYANIAQASKTHYLSAVYACKAQSSADALTLTSLIGKNDGSDPWLAISKPYGRALMFVNPSRGYCGVSEAVSVYRRETIKTLITTNNTHTLQDSGSAGSNIEFQGGYDTASGLQNGETFFDGQSGNGVGLHTNSKSYVTINHLSFVRYYYPVNIASSTYLSFPVISDMNSNAKDALYCTGTCTDISFGTIGNVCFNNGYGVALISSFSRITFDSIGNVNSNTGYGIALSGTDNTINSVASSSNNTQDGIYFNGSGTACSVGTATKLSYNNGQGLSFGTGAYRNSVDAVVAGDYNNFGIYFGSTALDNIVYSFNGTGNIYGIRLADNNYVKGGSFSESTSADLYTNTTQPLVSAIVENVVLGSATQISYSATTGSNVSIFCPRIGNVDDAYKIFTEGGTIEYQKVITDFPALGSWNFKPTNTIRNADYPMKLKLATVVCAAGSLVTVSARMRRSHTNMTLSLVCPKLQLPGITSEARSNMTAAADTWETVTISFTPTSKGGVDIYAYCSVVTGTTYNGYVCNLTVSQA